MEPVRVDVLIIGAGQAGLAIGYHLRQAPRHINFLIIDKHPRIGDSWRNRYDSLVLFTPRSMSALPGLKVPGDPEGFPAKNEIADYLEKYADEFRLPVRMNTTIRRLEHRNDFYLATAEDGSCFESQAVVLANGAFQKPAIPSIASSLSPDVLQLDSASYRSPEQVPPGQVLVVGDGATGRQFAYELATQPLEAWRPVALATGHRRRVVAERVLGHSLFWWADRLGLLDAPYDKPIGHYLMVGDTFPGKHYDLQKLRDVGVQVLPRVVSTVARRVSFKNASSMEVSTILWATGYRAEDGWVDVPGVKNDQGEIQHYRGVTPSPGLFLIGRSWQWKLSSALLHGVGDDAGYLAKIILYYLQGQTTPLQPVELSA